MLTTLEQLEQVYGQPHERAVRKEISYVNEDYRAFIEYSPFVVLATAGEDGLDCSPRGDAPGFVRVIDERTLAIPDRVGNNRVDSLRNIIVEPHLALLFVVPGVGESLRVNGRGRISIDDALLESFAVDGKRPRTVLIVDVDAVYFHCSRRSCVRNCGIRRGTSNARVCRARAQCTGASTAGSSMPTRMIAISSKESAHLSTER